MKNRIKIAQTDPLALEAMMGIENYLSTTTVSLELKGLIKVRASMINNCAYCIEMHGNVAQKHGMTANKLLALAAWQESSLFDETEQAVLALTDAMTLIADQDVSDEVYQAALKVLGETPLAQVMMQIIMINAWNRFSVATKMHH